MTGDSLGGEGKEATVADHVAAPVWWKDALERVVWTFVQAFVGALLADATGLLNLDAVKAAGLAGLAAVLAVIKTVAASRIGRQDAALPSPVPYGGGLVR